MQFSFLSCNNSKAFTNSNLGTKCLEPLNDPIYSRQYCCVTKPRVVQPVTQQPSLASNATPKPFNVFTEHFVVVSPTDSCIFYMKSLVIVLPVHFGCVHNVTRVDWVRPVPEIFSRKTADITRRVLTAICLENHSFSAFLRRLDGRWRS